MRDLVDECSEARHFCGHTYCQACGKQTTGAWSEGGIKWELCDDCMDKARDQRGDDGPDQAARAAH